jgi:uncharacterized protein
VAERISREAERRFVLGRQGLWPGRRWSGASGTLAALRECGRVQVDPLDVVGRSHDLVFASRVDGYRPAFLDQILYKDRQAFEHGGTLCIFPRERLRLHWSEHQLWGIHPRLETWAGLHPESVEKVRSALREHGALSSRHWIDGEPTEDYRSRRLEGMALHYLWRRLEIMVHHREGLLKFYDLTERLFGPMPEPLTPEETRDASAVELARWLGLSGRSFLSLLFSLPGRGRRDPGALRALRQRLIADGRLTEVPLERERGSGVLVPEAVAELEAVADGKIPKRWQPIDPEPETIFLAPLDVACAHGRARSLFGFEYLWEVYKPAAQRRWGYYVLPVLLGDRLVGRIEPVRDDRNRALYVRRAWWEAGIDPSEFVEPMARGLVRTAQGLGYARLRLGRVGPASFREGLVKEAERRFRASSEVRPETASHGPRGAVRSRVPRALSRNK